MAPSSATLETGQLLHYLLTVAPAVPITLTLPTVQEVVSLLNGAQVADAVEFVVRNDGTAIVTMAVPAGSGGSSGTLTITASQYRRFFIRLDSTISYTLLDAGAAQGVSSTASVWHSTTDSVTANPSIQLNTAVPGVAFTDDFVFGSSSTDDTGIATNDIRVSFRKNGTAIGAFRAGVATGTQWDEVNSGQNSVAFGLDNIASGNRACVSGGQ